MIEDLKPDLDKCELLVLPGGGYPKYPEDPNCKKFTRGFSDTPINYTLNKCIQENIVYMKHPETGEMILNLDTIVENCINP